MDFLELLDADTVPIPLRLRSVVEGRASLKDALAAAVQAALGGGEEDASPAATRSGVLSLSTRAGVVLGVVAAT